MEKALESLVEISKAINSVLDLDKLLEVIMDSAIAVSRAERGILFLKAPEGALESRVARNVEKETLANAHEISASITAEVAASGRYFLSSNLLGDPNLPDRPSVRAFRIQSVLCVPLVSKDAIIGTLYLDSRSIAAAFSEGDVQFMQAFANLAAIAIENAKLYELTKDEARYWKSEASHHHGFEGIVTINAGMEEVCSRARSVAATNLSVLITGESGTGKELLARAIHYHSPRRDKRFVPINCSALPEHILESELFGVRKGSFTGANADKKGLFEEADGGTMFLDEIADMQPALQAKLLRVLQEGEIRRVGDTQYRFVDVRVISATNKDITAEIQAARFREDLYYRLCGMQLTIPPLRFRTDDIAPLGLRFVRDFCASNGMPDKTISAEALKKLEEYPFPGNVRELQNIMRKAVLFSDSVIRPANIDLPVVEPQAGDPEAFSEATRQHIIRMLEKTGWNQTRAAELLGLNRTTLQAKMKKLGISQK